MSVGLLFMKVVNIFIAEKQNKNHTLKFIKTCESIEERKKMPY